MFKINAKSLYATLEVLLESNTYSVKVYHDPDGSPVIFTKENRGSLKYQLPVPTIGSTYSPPFSLRRDQLESIYHCLDGQETITVQVDRIGSICLLDVEGTNGAPLIEINAEALDCYKPINWLKETPLSFVESSFFHDLFTINSSYGTIREGFYFVLEISYLRGGCYDRESGLNIDKYPPKIESPDSLRRFPVPSALVYDLENIAFSETPMAFHYKHGKIAFVGELINGAILIMEWRD